MKMIDMRIMLFLIVCVLGCKKAEPLSKTPAETRAAKLKFYMEHIPDDAVVVKDLGNNWFIWETKTVQQNSEGLLFVNKQRFLTHVVLVRAKYSRIHVTDTVKIDEHPVE